LGGLLAEQSLSLPFFVAAGMSFLALVLVYLLLPESLPQGDRAPRTTDQPVFDLRSWWKALFSPIGPLLILTFLVTGGLMIFYGILGLYALERFGYGTSEVGVIFTILGLVSAIGQGFLVGPLTKRFGDSKVIKFGFLLSAVTLPTVMLPGQYVPLLITIGVFSLANALLIPAITSLTSKRTTLNQGLTMGLSNSFVSLGRIFGPTLGGVVFDLYWGLPFVTASVLMLIGFLVSLRWVKEKQDIQTGTQSA
jgi:DHA1 family multidrug resistance protein-like MFS transporter